MALRRQLAGCYGDQVSNVLGSRDPEQASALYHGSLGPELAMHNAGLMDRRLFGRYLKGDGQPQYELVLVPAEPETQSPATEVISLSVIDPPSRAQLAEWRAMELTALAVAHELLGRSVLAPNESAVVVQKRALAPHDIRQWLGGCYGDLVSTLIGTKTDDERGAWFEHDRTQWRFTNSGFAGWQLFWGVNTRRWVVQFLMLPTEVAGDNSILCPYITLPQTIDPGEYMGDYELAALRAALRHV